MLSDFPRNLTLFLSPCFPLQNNGSASVFSRCHRQHAKSLDCRPAALQCVITTTAKYLPLHFFLCYTFPSSHFPGFQLFSYTKREKIDIAVRGNCFHFSRISWKFPLQYVTSELLIAARGNVVFVYLIKGFSTGWNYMFVGWHSNELCNVLLEENFLEPKEMPPSYSGATFLAGQLKCCWR